MPEDEYELEPDTDPLTEEEEADLEDILNEDADDGETQEDLGEAEVEADETPEMPYVPYVSPVGQDADEALLRDGMTPELYSAMERMMEARIARSAQTMQAANIHVTAAAAEHPELFRQYGGRIQATLAELPPETRVKPEAVHIAIARLVMEEAPKGGLGKALRKLADLADGAKTSAPAAKAPKAPIPAAQRPPSPSSRGAAPSAPLTKVDRLMRDMPGLSKSEAQMMISSGSLG